MQPVRAHVCLSGCVQLSVGSAPSGCTGLDNICLVKYWCDTNRLSRLFIWVSKFDTQTQHCSKSDKPSVYFSLRLRRLIGWRRRHTHNLVLQNFSFHAAPFSTREGASSQTYAQCAVKPKCKITIQIICKVTKKEFHNLLSQKQQKARKWKFFTYNEKPPSPTGFMHRFLINLHLDNICARWGCGESFCWDVCCQCL